MFDLDKDFFALATGDCVVLALGFIVYAAFLLSIVRVVTKVAPEGRRLDPEVLGLNLFPGSFVVWLPITMSHTAGSLQKESHSRGVDELG